MSYHDEISDLTKTYIQQKEDLILDRIHDLFDKLMDTKIPFHRDCETSNWSRVNITWLYVNSKRPFKPLSMVLIDVYPQIQIGTTQNPDELHFSRHNLRALPFVHSCIRAFVHSCIRAFVHSCIRGKKNVIS